MLCGCQVGWIWLFWVGLVFPGWCLVFRFAVGFLVLGLEFVVSLWVGLVDLRPAGFLVFCDCAVVLGLDLDFGCLVA